MGIAKQSCFRSPHGKGNDQAKSKAIFLVSSSNNESIHFVCLCFTDGGLSHGRCLKRIDHGDMISVPSEKVNQIFTIMGGGFQTNQ